MPAELVAPLRVAMLSVHTSPLEQPGEGDAGGLNVYVLDLARALAERGVEVEIFTRATASTQPEVINVNPAIKVWYVPAGPFEGLGKEDLPGELCAFTAGLLQHAARQDPRYFDVVHSHYWLSGQVGLLAAERWGVPLVHTMHTMARVKNASLPPGDSPEPTGRILGEEQVVEIADALIASTPQEADDLAAHYGADRRIVSVIPPAVDLSVFRPAGPAQRDAEPGPELGVADVGWRRRLRRRLGLPATAPIVLFAGRVQALKAPDVLVRALQYLDPATRLVVLGGPSGRPTAVRELEALAEICGVRDRLLLHPPVTRTQLADWYRAADVVAVPSYNESFGLVAAEASASGVPVVAAAVGGLREVVRDGVTGRLVVGHAPQTWARALTELLDNPAELARLGANGAAQAARFGWDRAAAAVEAVYGRAIVHRRAVHGAK